MLKLKFFDVKLGNATLIQTDKINMLFDIGHDAALETNPLFSFDGKLDYLIITHPHEDHITGLLDINLKEPKTLLRNKNIPVNLINERINSTNNSNIKKVYKNYLELNKKYTKEVSPDNDPTKPNNNGGLEIYSITPNSESNDLNDYSITTILKYNNYTILLMGDNTPSNINQLLEFNGFLEKTQNIDILLAPHHGRESSYNVDFLNHLNPQITIISDESGKDEVSASDKYSSKSRGYKVYKNNNKIDRHCLTTRNDGTIEVIIENENLTIYCEK